MPFRACGSFLPGPARPSRGKGPRIRLTLDAGLKARSSTAIPGVCSFTSLLAALAGSVVPAGLGFHWLGVTPDLRPGLFPVVAPRLAPVLFRTHVVSEQKSHGAIRLLPTLCKEHARMEHPLHRLCE